jgi:L-lysine 2,3-aminomutase
MADIDVERVIQRLAAAGLVVGEQQAVEALSVSREVEAAQLYRSLAITGIEPMISFDPRWRR